MSTRARRRTIELAHQLNHYHSQSEQPHQHLFVTDVDERLQLVCAQEATYELPRHQPVPLDWALNKRALARDIREFQRLFNQFFTDNGSSVPTEDIRNSVTTSSAPPLTEYRETPTLTSQTSSGVASPPSPITSLELQVRQLSMDPEATTMSSTALPSWMRAIPRDTPSSNPNEDPALRVVYSKAQYKRDAVYLL
jgi:hypothetical protein